MILIWDESAWEDYLWWQAQDRRVPKRINTLPANITRNGNEGIGKPEALKQGFHGYWSRRISEKHQGAPRSTDSSTASTAMKSGSQLAAITMKGRHARRHPLPRERHGRAVSRRPYQVRAGLYWE